MILMQEHFEKNMDEKSKIFPEDQKPLKKIDLKVSLPQLGVDAAMFTIGKGNTSQKEAEHLLFY